MTLHHHASRDQRKPPAFIAALVITLAYAVVELTGRWWSGSLALMSDAGHMCSDDMANWPEILQAARVTLHDRFGIEHIALQPEQPQGRSTPVAIRLWPRQKKPYS